MVSEGLLGALLGALIGGFFVIGSNFSIDYYQNRRFKANLKKLILLEIESMEEGLKNIHESYKNLNGLILFYNSFYNEKGLYYNFQTDIQNLDKDEARIIYEFYSNLVSAENNRALIIQYIMDNPSLVDPISNEDSQILISQKQSLIVLSGNITGYLDKCVSKIDQINKMDKKE